MCVYEYEALIVCIIIFLYPHSRQHFSHTTCKHVVSCAKLDLIENVAEKALSICCVAGVLFSISLAIIFFIHFDDFGIAWKVAGENLWIYGKKFARRNFSL